MQPWWYINFVLCFFIHHFKIEIYDLKFDWHWNDCWKLSQPGLREANHVSESTMTKSNIVPKQKEYERIKPSWNIKSNWNKNLPTPSGRALRSHLRWREQPFKPHWFIALPQNSHTNMSGQIAVKNKLIKISFSAFTKSSSVQSNCTTHFEVTKTALGFTILNSMPGTTSQIDDCNLT